MEGARYSEENCKCNCSAFVWRIEPQASLLFVLSDKLLIMIDLLDDLRYDDLASSMIVVDPPNIYFLVRGIKFI